MLKTLNGLNQGINHVNRMYQWVSGEMLELTNTSPKRSVLH